MSNNVNKSDLGYLGEAFQYRLVHAFMEEKDFYKDLAYIINQNMFTNPNLRIFVGTMKDYLDKYDAAPTYESMEVMLFEKARNVIERDTYAALIEEIKNQESDGIDLIREKAMKFFTQQNMIKCANEMLKVAGSGNIDEFDRCMEIYKSAINYNTTKDMGVSAFNDIDGVLSDEYREVIPTGVKKVDEVLEGGIAKGEVGMIICPTGCGKVQPNDAVVVTPTGPKQMGEIHIGDYVIGANGKPTKVIGVFPHKNWDFYKVTFTDGVSCECGKEHLWNVNSKKQRERKTQVNYVRKRNPDLSYKTMSLGEIMDEGLYSSGRHNFRIQMCKPVEFEEKELLIDPYLMGVLLGDGNFSRCTITSSKDDYEELVENILSRQNKFSLKVYERKKSISISVVDNCRNTLKTYYDLSLTSGDKFIHQDYLINSIENRLALLQGLLDTDGTVCKKGACSYSTKSLRLAKDVRWLILSLGGFASISKKKAAYFSKKLNEKVDCSMHYTVMFNFPSDNKLELFKFKRKQERVKYSTARGISRYIDSVEFSRNCDGQCIKVESDEELYLTDDFIVTHNTSMTTAFAANAALNGFKVLQIVFEDSVRQIQRKHIGFITGIEAKDLSKPEYRDKVIEILDKFDKREFFEKNLMITRLSTGEVTASQLERYIKTVINNGFKPDMIVIDYFECLNHDCFTNVDGVNEREGKSMRKLEAMAANLNIAIWCPSQGNRDSIGAEVVTESKTSGSIKKAHIAHINMSIARTLEDKENNVATIAILKNRSGSAGHVFTNCSFNNGTCRISTDTCDNEQLLTNVLKKTDNALLKEVFAKAQKKST